MYSHSRSHRHYRHRRQFVVISRHHFQCLKQHLAELLRSRLRVNGHTTMLSSPRKPEHLTRAECNVDRPVSFGQQDFRVSAPVFP